MTSPSSRELAYNLTTAGERIEARKRNVLIARIKRAQTVAHKALEVALAVPYKDAKLAALDRLLTFDEQNFSV